MMCRIRASLAWLAFFAVPASATNLLTNPDFDAGISGWSTNCGVDVPPTWNGSAGSPTAGSVQLQAIFAFSCTSQCVDIAGGQSVDLSVRSQGDTCASDSAYAGAFLTPFDSPGCTGSPGTSVQTAPTGTISGWNVHALLNHTLAPSVQSVAVSPRLVAIHTSPTVNFDHVEFGVHSGSPPSPGAIVNPEFDGGLCGWKSGSAAAWDDTQGSPTPGSVIFYGIGTSSLVGACLDATENIDATVRSLGDSASQQAAGKYFVGMILNLFDQPGCGGNNLGFAQTNPTQVTSLFGWNLHSLIDYPLPAGAQSFYYSLNAYAGSTDFPSVNLDHVYVGPHRLFADGFE